MKRTPSSSNMPSFANGVSKLDEQFIKVMLEVEKHYTNFKKHEKIRIEQWSQKLCQVTMNSTWKQNRNLYALLLLDGILKGNLQDPFNKIPTDGHLPTLNKHIVKTRIGNLEEKLENMQELPAEYQAHKEQENNSSKTRKLSSQKNTPTKKLKKGSTPQQSERIIKRPVKATDDFGFANGNNMTLYNSNSSGQIKHNFKKSAQILKDGLRENPYNMQQPTAQQKIEKSGGSGEPGFNSTFKNERIVLSDVNQFQIGENQNFRRTADFETVNSSARQTDLSSVKAHQSPKSVRSTSKTKVQSKEILKLKGELELARLSEDSLKNDLNIKNVTINQLTRKVENQQSEMKSLYDERDLLLKFFKSMKRRLEDGYISFESKEASNEFYKDFNDICPQFFLSPVKNNINHEKIYGKTDNINNTVNSYLSKNNSSNIMYLSQSHHNQSVSNRKNQYDDSCLEEFDNYLKPQSNIVGNTSQTTSINIHNSNSKANKEVLGNNINAVNTGESNPSTRLTAKNENILKSSEKAQTYSNQKYQDMKKKLTNTSDKETASFLSYLDKFQQENVRETKEKLKKETEELLFRSSNYQTTGNRSIHG